MKLEQTLSELVHTAVKNTQTLHPSVFEQPLKEQRGIDQIIECLKDLLNTELGRLLKIEVNVTIRPCNSLTHNLPIDLAIYDASGNPLLAVEFELGPKLHCSYKAKKLARLTIHNSVPKFPLAELIHVTPSTMSVKRFADGIELGKQ